MKLTLQLIDVVLIAPTKFRDNLQQFVQIHSTYNNNNYLVFPRNFRMVFLPHTNTVILPEPYCGTMTEPGLPVITVVQRTIEKQQLQRQLCVCEFQLQL